MQHHPALPTRAPRIEITYRPIDQLKPDPRNPRRHERKQIRQIADSIVAFGFSLRGDAAGLLRGLDAEGLDRRRFLGERHV